MSHFDYFVAALPNLVLYSIFFGALFYFIKVYIYDFEEKAILKQLENSGANIKFYEDEISFEDYSLVTDMIAAQPTFAETVNGYLGNKKYLTKTDFQEITKAYLEKHPQEIQTQCIDPASVTLASMLTKAVVTGIVYSTASFFTKIGLQKLWEKPKQKPEAK